MNLIIDYVPMEAYETDYGQLEVITHKEDSGRFFKMMDAVMNAEMQGIYPSEYKINIPFIFDGHDKKHGYFKGCFITSITERDNKCMATINYDYKESL